jgi:HAD superfamily phosphoserine phosphatase-like hydrolase
MTPPVKPPPQRTAEPRASNRLAVFDVDGTLFRLPSVELRFMTYLLVRGMLSVRLIGRSLASGFAHGIRNGAVLRNYPRFWMQGLKLADLQRQAEIFLDRYMDELLIPDMRDRMLETRRQGCFVVLISGVPEFVLDQLGRRLDVHRVAGTRLVTDASGIITGRYEQPRPNGPGKSYHLLRIADEYGADLRHSIGFANEGLDAFHLALLGKAVAVNPDRRLMRVADHLGWETLHAG